MKFKADFHIHSRYSIATSRDLDFENLHTAAQLKGLTVVGTGDMTHPQWMAEAREKLVPAESGLYRLRDDIAAVCDARVPPRCRAPVRFILTSEISSIYKKGGRTRKNHNLVFLPDLEAAAVFSGRLDRIGNIKSDGRPILGLDARNLLELVLETSDQAFLVPAHIWTPWFSVLGSKSGFDRLSDCFEDLTGHIFAVETGLSSDPAMNWRVSHLDGLTLVSNSDAHSPMKLAREANLLDTALGYIPIRVALERGRSGGFLGTLEFFPEEGKYHLDGHRKCRVRLTPGQSLAAGGQCPACGRPLTLGVLHRVEELADREKGERPEGAAPFTHLVPLTDLLSEILRVGPNTRRVKEGYGAALTALGSELAILHEIPVDRIQRAGFPMLAEAVRRVRCHQVRLVPGYDGEFGKIRVFDDQEQERLSGQNSCSTLAASMPRPAVRKLKPAGTLEPMG